jgi:hypothetical protein
LGRISKIYSWLFHSSISLTKRILNYNGTQLHVSAGISHAKESAGPDGYPEYYDNFWGSEYGVIIGIRRFVISCFGEFLIPKLEYNIKLTKYTYANFGFGMRF